MRRAKGELERRLLEQLWARPEGMSARQLTDGLTGDALALTTVLTVLERLRIKGDLHRTGDRSSGYVYAAVLSESHYVARSMLRSLTASSDRQDALVGFVGRLDADDVRLLREALADRAPQTKPTRRSRTL